MFRARLRSSRMLSPRVRELSLAPPPGFRFEPGQFVRVAVPGPGGRTAHRDYSIASAPRRDGSFEVAVARVEGSASAEYLHTLPDGAELSVSAARGGFALGTLVRPVLMVAAGTGISPLRSMLLARAHEPSLPPFALLFGARAEDELLYAADFAALARAGRLARYVATLSDPSPRWSGRRGYVQRHAVEVARSLGRDVDVLLCGLSAMIDATRAVLAAELGLPPGRMRAERYD
jgi:anthranilate 1,2-dioxygenase reductase subunit